MENREEEVSIDIRDIIRIIKKRLLLIISISLCFALVAGLYSVYYLKPMYQSGISVVIGKSNDNTLNSRTDYTDVMMYQSLMKTYAKIAQSNTVGKNAAETLKQDNKVDADAIHSQIGVYPQTDTQILDIVVTDTNPLVAKEVVTAYTNSFITEATRIFPDGNVQIIDPAGLPSRPFSPNKRNNVMIAFMLGLVVAMGLSFVLEYIDNTFKSEGTLEKYVGLPVIGVIPRRLVGNNR